LPDNGSHTVVLVETVDSGVHWAEPFCISADQLLENMKNGEGARISSRHVQGVNVLFADGSIRTMPPRVPLRLWKKLLAGQLSAEELDNIESQFSSSEPDMINTYVGEERTWSSYFAKNATIFVWLVSVVLLFRRAVKSRKKNPDSTSITQQPAKTV
jgi:prepilin-type processing-associated H-X9-DG protein